MTWSVLTVLTGPGRAPIKATVPTGSKRSVIVLEICKRLKLDAQDLYVEFNGAEVTRGDQLVDGDTVTVKGVDKQWLFEKERHVEAVASPFSVVSDRSAMSPGLATSAQGWLLTVTTQPVDLSAAVAATGMGPLPEETDLHLPASWVVAEERARASAMLRQLGITFDQLNTVLTSYPDAMRSVSRLCMEADKAVVNHAMLQHLRARVMVTVPILTAATMLGHTNASTAAHPAKPLSQMRYQVRRYTSSSFLRHHMKTAEFNDTCFRLEHKLSVSLKEAALAIPSPGADHTVSYLDSRPPFTLEQVPALDAVVDEYIADRTSLHTTASFDDASARLDDSCKMLVRNVDSLPIAATSGQPDGNHAQVVFKDSDGDVASLWVTQRDLDDKWVAAKDYQRDAVSGRMTLSASRGPYSGLRCQAYDHLDLLLEDIEELSGVYEPDSAYVERAALLRT